MKVRMEILPKPSKIVKPQPNSFLDEGEELKKAEADDDDTFSDENDDDDDFSDEEYEDEDLLPGVDDDEEVMTECPDYCKCAGQYAAAMTATYVSNRIII